MPAGAQKCDDDCEASGLLQRDVLQKWQLW